MFAAVFFFRLFPMTHPLENLLGSPAERVGVLSFDKVRVQAPVTGKRSQRDRDTLKDDRENKAP